MIASAPAGGSRRPRATSSASSSRVVDDLVAAAEVRVLVAERVEAVRAARDDLRHAGLVERRHVLSARAPGTCTRCPSAGPGRRCTTRAGRGSRSRRPAFSRASRWRARSRGRARRTRRRSRPSRGPRAPGRRARARGRRAPRPTTPARSAACPTGSTARSTSRSIGSASAGKRDSTITRWRRRSTMWSTCSIETGHSCTQAPQVTQSQTTSSVTAFGHERLTARLRRGRPAPPRTAGRGGP